MAQRPYCLIHHVSFHGKPCRMFNGDIHRTLHARISDDVLSNIERKTGSWTSVPRIKFLWSAWPGTGRGSTGHAMRAEPSQDPQAKKCSEGSTSESLTAMTKSRVSQAHNTLPSVTQRVQIAVVPQATVQNSVVADVKNMRSRGSC